MRLYLDHNATTPMRPEVRALLASELSACGGNASSLHASGRRARAVVDEARQRVAVALKVSEEEVIFTSGGTEANNLALFGALRAAGRDAGLVTSAIEHSSILGPADALSRAGHPVRLVPVDAAGRLELGALEEAIGERSTRLVSLLAGNNEVGVVPALETIGSLCRARGPGRPLLHVDAVQALGRIPVRLEEWGADLATFSAHKVGGPVGVGVLARRPGTPLAPLMHGGGQEAGLRPGTESVPAIAAAALAVELAVREEPEYRSRVGRLATELWEAMRATISGARLLGPPMHAEDRLPNTLNVLFEGIDGRILLARLDLEGLELSAGSACASGSLEPSHVLLAMGVNAEEARASLRMSLGRTTGAQDVRDAVEILRRTVASMRATPV